MLPVNMKLMMYHIIQWTDVIDRLFLWKLFRKWK